jgi:transcriptional regulator with XRE-family HTH domain
MTDAAVFGLELRRARERRDLSLDQLADATKVSGALFAGLERGDLARWPGGIFRRAFVRAYAQAVGLDTEDTLARFLRIYPESEESGMTPIGSAADDAAETTSGPRLVLDAAAAAPRSTGAWLTTRRTAAALADLLFAGVPAAAVSLALGWHWFFPVAGLIGVVGHLAAIAFTGLTPGSRLFLPRPVVARRLLVEEDAQARRRLDADPGAAHRRRQPRHAAAAGSTPARPIPITRPRRLQ